MRFLPLRIANVAVVGILYALLYQRSSPFTSAYRVAFVLGAVAVGASIASLVAPRWLVGLIARPLMTRGAVRAIAVLGPWIGLVLVTASTGFWWSQQMWEPRLFATYVLFVWTATWCGGSPHSFQDGRQVRVALVMIGLILAVVSGDGLTFGITPFGVTLSAAVGVAAVLSWFAASDLQAAACGRYASLVISIVFALILVETGIRTMHLGESLVEVDDPDYVRRFHHIVPPNSAFINQPGTFDEFPPALIETNAFGTRGPDVPAPPIDLLIIGDSMVEARQLPWEDTVGARLPKALAARSVTAKVVAHGVRGWSPLLEWNWYLKTGRRLRPRKVVLFFFWNDLWSRGDEASTFRAVMGSDGRPQSFEVQVEPAWVWYKHLRLVRLTDEMRQRIALESVKRSLMTVRSRRSSLDTAAAEALAARAAADLQLSRSDVNAVLAEPLAQLSPRLQGVAGSDFWPGIRPLDLWTDEQRAAAAVTERELRLFADDVAADGGRLVLFFVPNAYQVSTSECSVARILVGLGTSPLLPERSGIQDWLREVANRQGIELLDPSAEMRAFLAGQPPAANRLYLRADCHWSAQGHQFVADFLVEWYAASEGPALQDRKIRGTQVGQGRGTGRATINGQAPG